MLACFCKVINVCHIAAAAAVHLPVDGGDKPQIRQGFQAAVGSGRAGIFTRPACKIKPLNLFSEDCPAPADGAKNLPVEVGEFRLQCKQAFPGEP